MQALDKLSHKLGSALNLTGNKGRSYVGEDVQGNKYYEDESTYAGGEARRARRPTALRASESVLGVQAGPGL